MTACWVAARQATTRPLLESLSFTQGKSNWGYAFRFGLLKVTAADMDLIVRAMHAIHATRAGVAAEMHAAG